MPIESSLQNNAFRSNFLNLGKKGKYGNFTCKIRKNYLDLEKYINKALFKIFYEISCKNCF